MTLTMIPGNALSYQAASSDITSGSKIVGASYIGATVFITDTGLYYRVQSDLTLVPMPDGNVSISGSIPAVISGSPAVQIVGNPNVTVSGSVASISVTADADITQLIFVSASATPVQGPNKSNPSGWIISAAPNNSGNMYIMYHGQTVALKGYPFSYGTQILVNVQNLSSFDFGSDNATGGSAIALKV